MPAGRPKATGPEAQAIFERRMKVLALRRDGYTMAASGAALGVSANVVNTDIKWLRKEGYDLGEAPVNNVLPPPGGTIPQLRVAAAADEEAAVRREVNDRRIRGENILMISIAMRIPTNEVRRHIHDAAQLAREGETEERRALQLARLDRLLMALNDGIQDGNPKAINAAVRVIAEGNRLQGLYLPIQIEHTVITVDMIDHEMQRLSAELAKVEGRELTAYVDVEGEPVD